MFYGWRLLGVLSFIYFMSIGIVFYGFAVTLPEIIATFGWSRGQASTGFAITGAALGLSGPLVAAMITRIGTRLTIFAGGFVTASGALLTYFTTSLVQFYISAGLLLGLGMAMQTIIPGTQLVSNWFARRRALAIGLFMASGGLGGGLVPPLTAYAIEATGSWRVIWLAMAAGALFSSFLALVFVKERPADLGQQVDGATPDAAGSLRSNTQPARVYQTSATWSVGDALRTPTFWMVVMGASIAVLGGSLVNSQALLHLQDVGIDKIAAASALGIIGFLGILGRLISGSLGDHVEPKLLLAFGLFFSLGGVLALEFTQSLAGAYLFAVLFGFGNGLALVTSPMLLANYFGNQNYAPLYATRGVVVTVVSSIGPVAAGTAYDWFDSYSHVFWGYVLLAGAAGLVVLLIRPPHLGGGQGTPAIAPTATRTATS